MTTVKRSKRRPHEHSEVDDSACIIFDVDNAICPKIAYCDEAMATYHRIALTYKAFLKCEVNSYIKSHACCNNSICPGLSIAPNEDIVLLDRTVPRILMQYQ